jgi:hypothetical protein
MKRMMMRKKKKMSDWKSVTFPFITIHVGLISGLFFLHAHYLAYWKHEIPKLRFDSTFLHTHDVSIYRQVSILLASSLYLG